MPDAWGGSWGASWGGSWGFEEDIVFTPPGDCDVSDSAVYLCTVSDESPE